MRTAMRWAGLGAILLVALTLRVVTSAAHELAAGEANAARGELPTAIVHFRRAARWYAPFSPYHVRALVALSQIGERAERAGDSKLALLAYRAIRSGVLSTRSFYTPESERLAAANARIADLMAAAPPPPVDADKTREQLRKEHLALLQQDTSPALGWTVVLLLGFFTWVAGALMFASRAIDEREHYIPREVRRWGAVIVVGLCLFVTGMALA